MATPTPRRDRQVVRVLGLLKTLTEGGHPTVHQLAARFKTRRETIYRDLRTIEAIGYPIVGDDSGRLSRPRLAPEARMALPPVALSSREIAALAWAVKQVGPREPFSPYLATASTKLQALTPSRNGRVALSLDGAVGGWTRGTKDYSAAEATILELVKAIISQRRCLIAYQSPGRKTPRRFPYDPYRLLSVQDGLYCVGRVPAYENLVTLAIERIRSLELTEQGFAVDPTFDPKRLEADAFGVVWDRPMSVVVRFSAEQAPYVRERDWHPTQTLRDMRDGRVELTFRAGGMFEIVRWILGWGAAAEVVRPVALREEVKQTASRMAASYASRSAGHTRA
ncbi:MAG: WYL domain-containing transcriptional regulator [Candidatus Rokubacteria bacterium]|nr:WYL domain-containing transcriptional regulator [Candidatus Rokubacteria bacterium]